MNPKAPLINHVYWARTDLLPPEAIRDNRDLLVRGGVRTLELDECEAGTPPCPVKKTGHCGQAHPRWEPLGRQLDDLVRDIAAAQFVAVAVRTAASVNRFWISAGDKERYLDAGGVLVDDLGGNDRGGRTHGGRVPERRQVECTKEREDDFDATPTDPRDTGATLRPSITLIPRPAPDRYAAKPADVAPDQVGIVRLRVAFLKADAACREARAGLPSGRDIAAGLASISNEQRARCDAADRARMEVVLAIHGHPWWATAGNRVIAEQELRRLAEAAITAEQTAPRRA